MTQEDLGARFVTAVERHAVDELRALLAAGLDVRRPVHTVRRLVEAGNRAVPPLGNVPNRYLQPRR